MNVLEVSLFNLLEQVTLIFGTEGIIALQHHVIQDSQRPHVCINRTVVHFRYNLRGHVCGSPAKGVYGLLFFTSQTEPKINQFQLLVSIDQDVFGFDISMDDVKAMQILECLCYNKNEFFSLFLLHSMLRL